MSFTQLNIIPPILKSLADLGYEKPTPIQEQAIPPLMEGRDLLGCAQTGTGKTAAFAIPILQRIFRSKSGAPKGKRAIRALILSPTRELASQINDSFKAYGRFLGLKSLVIFGGVSQRPQAETLRTGVDVLVATPGRLLDLLNQRLLSLDGVEYFVLDEADHMLDMGFIHDVKKIISRLPGQRQTMLFSATMPYEIMELADSILHEPITVSVTPEHMTVDAIEQSLYYVSKPNKKNLLIHLLKNKEIESALVFSRTKHGADKITKDLMKAGIEADAIHGNKSQQMRQTALRNFKNRQIRVLVATDIAARGIDIDELSHVINYDLPEVPETYVHRIGRTGRAGLGGVAISFCDEEEKKYLRDIQNLIGKKIPVIADHPFRLVEDVAAAPAPKANFAYGHRRSFTKRGGHR